jgi:hypothetical protein
MTHEEKEKQLHELNMFAELVAVIDLEHLIRYRKRLQKKNRIGMVDIMTREIKQREADEKAEQEKEDNERKNKKKEK